MNVTKILMLLVLHLLIMSSCKTDPCDDTRTGRDFLLSETSKEFVANYNNKTTVVFKDQNEVEHFFSIVGWDDNIYEYSLGLPCENDPSSTQTNEGKTQFIELQLLNDNFEKPIYIVLSRSLEANGSENINISYGDYRNSNSDFEGLLGFDVLDNSSSVIDEVELGGGTFFEVREGMAEDNGIEIKFNKEFGVIFLKQLSNGIEYIYERIE